MEPKGWFVHKTDQTNSRQNFTPTTRSITFAAFYENVCRDLRILEWETRIFGLETEWNLCGGTICDDSSTNGWTRVFHEKTKIEAFLSGN